MRLKSYFASTVEEAISLASRELGEDAMLVYSRETMPEARNLGRYEVVFALEADEQGVAPSSPVQPAARTGAISPPISSTGSSAYQAVEVTPHNPGLSGQANESSAPWRELRADLLEMKRQFAAIERLIVHTTGAIAANRWSAPCEELYQEMLAHEFPNDLAAAIVSAADRGPLSAQGYDREAAVAELVSRIGALPCGAAALRAGCAHAFIGPAGGGKTTMLVKLAVLLGMEQRLPVMLVSLDSRRIGGSDQLKTFAQILGVPFTAIDHRSALERLLENEGRRQTLFFDTPGFSDEDLAELAWLSASLRNSATVQTHLVLPAHLRTRDWARLVRRYEPFQPSSLMLTHMDESETVGGVLGEMLRFGLPISFCGTGQSIPEEIRACDPEWLARRALPSMGETASVRAGGSANWAVA